MFKRKKAIPRDVRIDEQTGQWLIELKEITKVPHIHIVHQAVKEHYNRVKGV